MEDIRILLDLYKQDRVTEYALEKELSLFLGERSIVKIVKGNAGNATTTFGIFAVPEKLVEGFSITYYIDHRYLVSLCEPCEVEKVLYRLKGFEEKLLLKYHRFSMDHLDGDISLGVALAFALRAYKSYRDLVIANQTLESILPSEDEIEAILDSTDGTDAKIETLLGKRFVAPEIIDSLKRYVREAVGAVRVHVNSSEREVPSFNIGQQVIRSYCTSDHGTRLSTEVPYNYEPKTNQ